MKQKDILLMSIYFSVGGFYWARGPKPSAVAPLRVIISIFPPPKLVHLFPMCRFQLGLRLFLPCTCGATGVGASEICRHRRDGCLTT